MTLPFQFSRYVAVGDSMSIDLYPGLDEAERNGHAEPRAGLGAASLLYRNDDEVFPEFAGRDLVTAFRDIELVYLCVDAATTEDVLGGQVPAMPNGGTPLVTITAGGNDLLAMIGVRPLETKPSLGDVQARIQEIVRRVLEKAPGGLVLLTTVWDPSDGTRDLEKVKVTDEEMAWLAEYNATVRALCDGGRVRLADAHRHFLGHGITAPLASRWFWTKAIIEPGFLGANELRRLWLGAL